MVSNFYVFWGVILGCLITVTCVFIMLIKVINKNIREERKWREEWRLLCEEAPFWKKASLILKLKNRFAAVDKPRYVYEDFTESTKYLPKNGRVIGYRLAPNWVLHRVVIKDVNLPRLIQILQTLHSRLLTEEELACVRQNLHDLNAMRALSDAEPLNAPLYWAQSEWGTPMAADLDSTLREFVTDFMCEYPLIMKF